MCSLPCINTNFIYICNTNECIYKSIYNLYCFVCAPTCFGHTLTIFRTYILKCVVVHIISVLKHRKVVHISVQGRLTKSLKILQGGQVVSLPDRPTEYGIPFDKEIFKLLNFYSVYLKRRSAQLYDVLRQKLYVLLHILRPTLDTKM